MMISEPTPFSHPFNFNNELQQRVHPLSASPSAANNFFRTTSPPINDDVTTIFVVGFPEDMAEREFQNMFTFCPGFEAASLKWHCKDQEEEIPSSSLNGKKQMIGFARFRTRLEALEAIEVLGGKKVDQDKGTVLKAEMAKKNLHIKRGSAGQTTSASSSTTSQPITSTTSSTSSSSLIDSTKLNRYETFSPLPSDLFSPHQDYKSDPFMDNMASPPSAFSSESLFSSSGLRSQSFSVDQDLGNGTGFMAINRPPSFPVNNASIIPSRLKSSLEDSTHVMDPYHYLSKSSPVPNDSIINNSSFFMHPRYDSSSSFNTTHEQHKQHQHQHHHSNSTTSLLDQDLMRMSSLSILTNNNASSPSLVSPRSNPADQNPPCNTLYVGNLPPNTSEEELRQVFSCCKGYRRMCFRTKPQGPMCFVEFEDIVYASTALNELQGHNLTNSVKGGIRLSYSKNPLFIKPTGKDNSFKQMGNILMERAGSRDFVFDPQL